MPLYESCVALEDALLSNSVFLRQYHSLLPQLTSTHFNLPIAIQVAASWPSAICFPTEADVFALARRHGGPCREAACSRNQEWVPQDVGSRVPTNCAVDSFLRRAVQGTLFEVPLFCVAWPTDGYRCAVQ